MRTAVAWADAGTAGAHARALGDMVDAHAPKARMTVRAHGDAVGAHARARGDAVDAHAPKARP